MARPLFSPDSLTWRINRERLVLLAGPCAAILQAAHPQVALGVSKHSRFRSDTTGRLSRTLDAVYAVAFGTAEEVASVRSRVAKAHAGVRGDDPQAYSAFDPGAQLWVLATLIMGSVTMYERFVEKLPLEDLDAFVLENGRFGEVFGLDPELVPGSWEEFLAYWQGMVDSGLLGSHPSCGEVARAVARPDRPWYFRMLSPVWRSLTCELLPPGLAGRLGLGDSAIRPLLWGTLDAVLPPLLPRLPERWRYAPAYLVARERRCESPRVSPPAWG